VSCTIDHIRRDIQVGPDCGHSSLPSTLADFRGFHDGETILVCGCGTSLSQVVAPERYITVGVNDVGRMFQPDYLVVLNPKEQFHGDRFRFVEESRAKAVFTQLKLPIPHPHIVQIRLGKFGGVDFSDPNCLHHTRNSPYLAMCLAIHMGAKRIGLIGVDFTNDHFFGQTGQHPLARQFAQIDQEYKRLYDACIRKGIELVNLSQQSRLTALPKMSPQQFARIGVAPEGAASFSGRKVFFVNYKFLSCGDVFRDGLSSAADDLGLRHEEAYWDDQDLADKVRQFSPDLMFVVHGRRFAQRWKNRFAETRSALWLLDEPYEVDDTARFSNLFDKVFINDPATLHRHRNAHYLPVCYDPARYFYHPGTARKHAVGFIGGYNPLREQMLETLARRGLLSYVVGGPWRKPPVQALCLSNNIPAEQTAELYRDTKIILNVFRTSHHFNWQSLAATSLNPRIYEGAACGALVISEDRPEVGQVCSDLPVFSSADELASLVEELLLDRNRYEARRKECIRQLARHTYAERLHAALNVIFEKETSGMSTIAPALENAPAEISQPAYSILMAVHNALPMTQLSTLRTLKHSGTDARLIVVDNASNDGTQKWLRLLAQRGDIQLITNKSNVGHGPALEQARRAAISPYIVTLDSDAYPLSDDWLQRLRERLNGPIKLAGIRHHRDYIHPSCLMVERKTLDQLGLTFLDEKGRPSQFDVAERISHEVKRRGFQISGLEQTSSLRRGSISEPVDLGVGYSGIVHHQWYTTRAAIAAGVRVDDVPNEAIEQSLKEVLDQYYAEPCELALIVGVRTGIDDTDRLRNIKVSLQALNLQDLERWRYRIIAVEQDSEPHMESILAPLVDRYIPVYNPGPYNRGWGFNVGACAVAASKALCLIDADLLVAPTFLSSCLKRFKAGQRALRPFREIAYLDGPSTEQAIARRMAAPMSEFSAEQYRGQIFTDSNGGCIWVEPRLYQEMGGHDERFRGWGCEDRDLWRRLAQLGPIENIPGRLVHLEHSRPNMVDRWAVANSRLNDQLATGKTSSWTGPMGNPRRYLEEQADSTTASARSRDWENWHRWEQQRIDRIVTSEVGKPIKISARWRLAQILLSLGQTLLDVGCGPGAIWTHLEPHRGRFSWTGIDATQQMLDVAHRRFPQVPLFRGDSGALPFADGEFDVVLLRHVLEHQPPWLMERSLIQAMRVAKRAVVVGFYVTPSAQGPRFTHRVGENFLETRWTQDDIKAPIATAGWQVQARFNITAEDCDEVWVLTPKESHTPTTQVQATGPKVSIIMPTFRRCHTILRVIKTIWAQTYQNWELILVDNSGDGGYQFADPRIRVYRHSDRASASYARNRGVRHATGDLVCFFDDDDDMFPTYLERFVTTFRAKPQVKMVRCGMLVGSGRTDYSHATPECCLSREDATPSWNNHNYYQDQHYFSDIVARNRWSEANGDIVILREALCRSNGDPYGGLRAGNL
jgi:glycosyltransferase involved in cell wall biosynthesis